MQAAQKPCVWQARQRPETELGDPDSRFSVIDGVNVHWKLHSSAPSSQTAEPRPSNQAPDGSYAKSSQHPDSNQDLMGFFEATGQEGPQQQQETTAAQAAASDGRTTLSTPTLLLIGPQASCLHFDGQTCKLIACCACGN